MLGHTVKLSDIGQVDLGACRAGEFDLGFLGSLLESLQCHGILAQVHAVLLLELVGNPCDDALVKVVAAQVGVTVGGLHLKHAVAQFQDRDIKCTATQVKHGNPLVAVVLVQAIGQSGCGGLVDDALHLQAGYLASLLGGLALGVVEVCGHGDDGLIDGGSQVILGGLLHLLQNHRRNLLRGVLAVGNLDTRLVTAIVHHLVRHTVYVLEHVVIGLTHETLDRKYGTRGVHDGLTLSRITDDALATILEGNYRWGRVAALAVGNHNRLGAFQNRNTRVSCS